MPEKKISSRSDGMSDERLAKATGKKWSEWVTVLDAAGAKDWKHPEIARWLVSHHAMDGWWAQTVTVGYEQAKGMRQPGQMADGTYSVSVSKTFPLAQQELLDTVIRAVSAHLDSKPATESRDAKFITARWKLPKGDGLLATVNPSLKGKTSVSLTHSRIQAHDAVPTAKARLKAWLEGLGV